MSGWTKEPWIAKTCKSCGDAWIMDEDDVSVMNQHADEDVCYHDADKPTADRVVACVNAMSGIEDPEAFIKAADEMFEAADGFTNGGCGEFYNELHVYRKARGASC